jgi:hydroxypyruvate reductase
LILSDVVGDSLDAIGSGPTAPDSTTFHDALNVLERHDLIERVPAAVTGHLQLGANGEAEETPKSGDRLFELVENVIIGSNRQSAQAAVSCARKNGLNALLLTSNLEGEARDVGRQAAAMAKDLVEAGRPVSRPACLVLGGETTVTIQGTGRGGRNQEVALSAVDSLEGLENVVVVALATDGQDGPTDAAGAVATGETLARAGEFGLSPIDYLDNNDAYPFFESLGDLILTGPTHTNVADLLFVFAF